MTSDQTTTTTLFEGQLKVVQKKKGYRFSVDAAILAHHIHLKAGGVAIDLGTGCGIILLILAHRNPSARLYGIEIQKDLADLASLNVRLNRMESAITIIHGDIKEWRSHLQPGMADVVFTNPPYRKIFSGRISPENERAVARHELRASLSDILSAAEKLLKPSGNLIAIYPAERAADLLAGMRTFGLEPKRLRWVYTKEGADAELVLAEGSKYGRAGLKVSPPLVLCKRDGAYTDEAKQMLGQQEASKEAKTDKQKI